MHGLMKVAGALAVAVALTACGGGAAQQASTAAPAPVTVTVAAPATPAATAPASYTSNLDGTPRALPAGVSLDELCAYDPAPTGAIDPACVGR